MLPEYDFSKGVRGKYAGRYAAARDTEQRAELDQRLDDMEANPHDSLPWERVRAKIMSELKEVIEQLPRKDLFALGEWIKERCEDEAFKDFSLASALRGMEDEPDLYREEQ
jgi:hypothetical protein